MAGNPATHLDVPETPSGVSAVPSGASLPAARDIPGVTLLEGHCIDELRKLPANSVHCVVTSPPYYGLRDYKLPPMVWGGDPKCKHVWAAKQWRDTRHTPGAGEKQATNAGSTAAREDFRQSDTCFHCGAWRGCLGLEPSPKLYLEHIVMVFREVRRVLHSSGTCWVNMGDSYVTKPAGGGTLDPKYRNGHERNGGKPRGNATNHPEDLGLKSKDLLMMPARVALALQEDGWYLRSQIPWAKASAMPESTEDRPTSALEYVFLLSKSQEYFYDREAGRIDSSGTAHGRGNGVNPKANMPGPNSRMRSDKDPYHQLPSRVAAKQNRSFSAAVTGLVTTRARRNTDWLTESLRGPMLDEQGDPLAFFVNPQPFSLEMCDQCKAIYPQKEYRKLEQGAGENGARVRYCKCGSTSWVSHFATFPEAIVAPCIRLGTSEYGCCSHCGAFYERIVEKEFVGDWHPNGKRGGDRTEPQRTDAMPRYDRAGTAKWAKEAPQSSAPATLGWRPTCDHPLYRHEVVPCVVLDPFAGTGRTLAAAMKLGRHAVGCELSPNYVLMERYELQRVAELLKCERLQEAIRNDPKSDKDPAYLVTMGIEDLEHEKRLIAGGAA